MRKRRGGSRPAPEIPDAAGSPPRVAAEAKRQILHSIWQGLLITIAVLLAKFALEKRPLVAQLERHHLFHEAAEEFEAALQETPESNNVLERALNAHKLAGEGSRARALEKLLRAGASAP